MKRLASKEARDGKGSTDHLASFDGQIDFLSALISRDDVKFCPNGLVQKFDRVIGRRAGAGGAALGRVRSPSDIVNVLVRRIRAHVEQIVRPLETSQPSKFGPLKLNFASSDQLIEIERGQHRTPGQLVGRSEVQFEWSKFTW